MVEKHRTINFRVRINPGTYTRRRPEYHGVLVIGLTRVSATHDWQTTPVRHLNYNGCVSAAAVRRPDMERSRQLEQECGEKVARNAWGDFPEAHKWFHIPRNIETARMFVRDELEAYYIDAMNPFMHLAAASKWKIDFQVVDIPFVAQKNSLLGRWWNRIQLAGTFQREAMFWNSHRLLVPSDSLETAMTVENVPYLLTVYP